MSDDPAKPEPEDDPNAATGNDSGEPPAKRNTVLKVVLAIVIGIPALLLVVVVFVLGACFLAYS